MENKEYYYLDNEDKIGPLSLEKLKKVELSENTLIWYSGLDDWTRIGDVPELISLFMLLKKLPPPIPNKVKEYIKTELSGELKFQNIKQPNEILSKIKQSKNALIFLLIWTGINLFALITSYSEIDFFSKGTPSTNEFWPFVEIFETHFIWNKPGTFDQLIYGYKEVQDFNGLFYRYDWSEFLIYVGGALLIYIIISVSKQKI
ncbi:MAG: DUF4339 domain-containing protein [Candidatus Shapirobacteria bacterium]